MSGLGLEVSSITEARNTCAQPRFRSLEEYSIEYRFRGERDAITVSQNASGVTLDSARWMEEIALGRRQSPLVWSFYVPSAVPTVSGNKRLPGPVSRDIWRRSRSGSRKALCRKQIVRGDDDIGSTLRK